MQQNTLIALIVVSPPEVIPEKSCPRKISYSATLNVR
jgi:hypothetical protein